MIRYFCEYCNHLFPSIDTEIKNAVRDAVKQINMTQHSWFCSSLLNDLSQGDIVDKVPFSIKNEDGTTTTYMTKGIILSNTCDLQRDKSIIIAPLFDISLGTFNDDEKRDLKDNVYSAKMCFKNSFLDNYFVDFSQSEAFNRNVIKTALDRGIVKRVASLTQFACYMLYTKLTVYYMRIENHEWFQTRNEGV